VNFHHGKITDTLHLKITRVRNVHGQLLDAKRYRIQDTWSPRRTIKRPLLIHN